jgi:glutamyl/glutaminyl-tRNA synthetase
VPVDEGGLDLAQDPAREMGDPVLRRRDGAIAYHLAVVVDDAAAEVTRVVRGRDLAASTAIQHVLQHHLDLATPSYYHHFLLLEQRGGKFAKLHGAVGWRELEAHMSSGGLCAFLARVAGLHDSDAEVTPAELVADFDWQRVARDDAVLRFGNGLLEVVARRPAELSIALS